MSGREFHAIGKRSPRKDGLAKVTGVEIYSSDVSLPNMLHARVLRSPYPHARVRRIDTSDAEKSGAICVTFQETPKIIYSERISSALETIYKDMTVLTDKLLHVGDRIAAVAAETAAEAERALKLIKVEYDLFDAVLDPIDAMKPGKPALHDSIVVKDKEIKIENNVAARVEMSFGDVAKGFEQSDVVIENEYRTGRPYHAQLETKSVVCQPEPDGGLTIWTTTQSIHDVRILIGKIFGIPLSKVNVKKMAVGGSFGSSIHLNSIIPICAALALKARRPVKLVSSREEDMHSHCRYPVIMRCKLGAKRDGTLVAGKMEAVADIGAYNTQVIVFLIVMNAVWFEHYKIPNMEFQGTAVYTNKVPGCAMVGFGGPQVTFAMESLIDELAEKLGMDSIELRLKNHVKLGDDFTIGPNVSVKINSIGMEEILKKGAELIGWQRRPKPGGWLGDIKRGIGLAKGFHTSGTGSPIPVGAIDYSSAMVKINEDGTVDLATSLTDLGGGTTDACVKVVAEELGVPLDNVNLSPVDTRTTAYDVCTHASRGTYVGGLTAKKVAGQAKRKLLEYASRILGTSPEALKVRPDEKMGQGIVYAEGVQGKEITIGEVAEIARQNNWGTIAAADSYTPVGRPPTFTAYFIEVEVNTKTGQIKPVRAVMGDDSGTIMNPELAEGQIHGGLQRGVGYALFEDTKYDAKTGELLDKGYLTDCKTLTASDMPSIKNTTVFFTDTPDPAGPFGAKGMGESVVNPVAAAVANAVYNATGVRFKEIPITPEKVLAALKTRHE